jgi:transcriptional regulator of arginine metabolism
MKMKRKERLRAIKEIINSKRISSQEELRDALLKIGADVTQSTISRDIRDIRLTKIRNFKQEEYYVMDKSNKDKSLFTVEKLQSKFKESVISTNVANNILVVKTYPGEAQGTAAIIDGMNYIEILGTVAGDDTIFCVIDNNENALKVHDALSKL